LECEGEAVGFSVFKTGDIFLCREDRDANPRTLKLPESEKQRLRAELDKLLQQKGKLLNLSGKSRPMTGGDAIKARQKVRNALQVVLRAIEGQDAGVGGQLGEALGEGDPVTFRPPPEWNV